ncbi:hypothetical protein D9M71_127070 [compost metagenome]
MGAADALEGRGTGLDPRVVGEGVADADPAVGQAPHRGAQRVGWNQAPGFVATQGGQFLRGQLARHAGVGVHGQDASLQAQLAEGGGVGVVGQHQARRLHATLCGGEGVWLADFDGQHRAVLEEPDILRQGLAQPADQRRRLHQHGAGGMQAGLVEGGAGDGLHLPGIQHAVGFAKD